MLSLVITIVPVAVFLAVIVAALGDNSVITAQALNEPRKVASSKQSNLNSGFYEPAPIQK